MPKTPETSREQQERATFYQKAAEYRAALGEVRTFDDHVRLWRATEIPYRVHAKSPFSVAYREEILEIYQTITQARYATANEMTSPLQDSGAAFEAGFPWQTGNLSVVALELAKTAQAIKALADAGMTGKRIVEFGAGWGNLAVPLARASQEVSVVDIDPGFLARIKRICGPENIDITTVESDFTSAVDKLVGRFDAVIFQASFHHCLEFDLLLKQIKESLLAEGGRVFFLSEPVFDDYAFPWGLRYDGESLWAIMCNKWLELGFDRSFFSNLLLRNGFFMTRLPAISGLVGNGWCAIPDEQELSFARWVLPKDCDESFHPFDGSAGGRFCKRRSFLPELTGGRRYRLGLVNHAPIDLRVEIGGETPPGVFTVRPGGSQKIDLPASTGRIEIRSETFCPAEMIAGSGDARVLGIHLLAASVFA
jgi:2-polyprenyl-3-methyl-5-hydroxy-6-metoxy-1,4-benzoquinol methylase